MQRSLAAVVAGTVLLGSGCAARLVELPTDRRPAAVVQLGTGPLLCPADTVTIADDGSGSGAGAVPAGFEGRTVLLCVADFFRSDVRRGEEVVAVDQWQAPMTEDLRAALDLPDREPRPPRACADATGGSTAVYVVDRRRRAVRVLLPSDDPCSRTRPKVAELLPTTSRPADASFTAVRR